MGCWACSAKIIWSCPRDWTELPRKQLPGSQTRGSEAVCGVYTLPTSFSGACKRVMRTRASWCPLNCFQPSMSAPAQGGVADADQGAGELQAL